MIRTVGLFIKLLVHIIVPLKKMLLQTGKANVYNIDDERCSSLVRIMFDGGSQRSYVTEAVKEQRKTDDIRYHLPLVPLEVV